MQIIYFSRAPGALLKKVKSKKKLKLKKKEEKKRILTAARKQKFSGWMSWKVSLCRVGRSSLCGILLSIFISCNENKTPTFKLHHLISFGTLYTFTEEISALGPEVFKAFGESTLHSRRLRDYLCSHTSDGFDVGGFRWWTVIVISAEPHKPDIAPIFCSVLQA